MRPTVGSELAEAVGTFALVLAGCGAIMTHAMTGELGHFGIAATFGLVVGAMVYATGHVSGAHFNPAVTLAFAATGHFPWRRVPGYVAAQSIGALAAAATLLWLLGPIADLGTTTPLAGLAPATVWVIEALLAATLMFVIASVATDGRAVGQMAGLAIGSTVALGSAWAGPLTGASMNPARSLGPALMAGQAHTLLPYLIAPIAGAVTGAFLYEAMRSAARPIKGPAPAAHKEAGP